MNFLEAADLLNRKDRFLILTHRRPDGDTVGCAAGLCAALRGIGKLAFVQENAEITPRMRPFAERYFAVPDYAPAFIVTVDIADAGLMPRDTELPADRIDLALDFINLVIEYRCPLFQSLTLP